MKTKAFFFSLVFAIFLVALIGPPVIAYILATIFSVSYIIWAIIITRRAQRDAELARQHLDEAVENMRASAEALGDTLALQGEWFRMKTEELKQQYGWDE